MNVFIECIEHDLSYPAMSVAYIGGGDLANWGVLLLCHREESSVSSLMGFGGKQNCVIILDFVSVKKIFKGIMSSSQKFLYVKEFISMS